MNQSNFLENNCTFSLLKPELLKECKPFICGDDDLDDFFTNNSALYTEQLLGKTYCFRLDKDLSIITCAFTVANVSTEQQEKEYLGSSENASLLTRLMIYDLINIV